MDLDGVGAGVASVGTHSRGLVPSWDEVQNSPETPRTNSEVKGAPARDLSESRVGAEAHHPCR